MKHTLYQSSYRLSFLLVRQRPMGNAYENSHGYWKHE